MNQKFVAVDRDNFRVTVYQLDPDTANDDWEDRFGFWKRERRYDVSIGALGYATPKGPHYVSSKALNPNWRMPSSEWVPEGMRGKLIPGGHPDNPLKAAFIALGGLKSDGVGFHGTADLNSIGTRASHGCIRMRPDDVLDLYERIEQQTLVFVY
jgi:lipoprotein-anchoring transpeptidase ErfK/SrfK